MDWVFLNRTLDLKPWQRCFKTIDRDQPLHRTSDYSMQSWSSPKVTRVHELRKVRLPHLQCHLRFQCTSGQALKFTLLGFLRGPNSRLRNSHQTLRRKTNTPPASRATQSAFSQTPLATRQLRSKWSDPPIWWVSLWFPKPTPKKGTEPKNSPNPKMGVFLGFHKP